jgi:hypothetical protein
METVSIRHPSLADRHPQNVAKCPFWRKVEKEPYLDEETAGYCGEVEHAHTCVKPTDYEACPFYTSKTRT